MAILTGEQLRRLVGAEELDYTMLISILSPYKQPRSKIKQFLADETLIRVKKGLYVFGPKFRQEPYSTETLANLIYGPSAISLEYALSFYGIIPEQVAVLTSITPKKNKIFKTPVGTFRYQYLNYTKYSCGLTQFELNSTHPILIATPEKSLVDYLYFHCDDSLFNQQQDLLDFLENDLRADFSQIKQFDKILLNALYYAYKLRSVYLLIEYLDHE